MFPDLTGRVVAVDLETTGLRWQKDRAFGAAWAYRDGAEIKSGYVDLRSDGALRWLREQLQRAARWVNHNIRFDAHFMRQLKVQYPPLIECTMVREALIDEHRVQYGLDALCKDYFGFGKEDIWPELAAQFGGKPTKDAQISNLVRAPTEVVAKYAIRDAECALMLWEAQEKIIEEQELRRIVDIERRLLMVIINMERIGVRVDLGAAQQALEAMSAELIRAQRELDSKIGEAVNVNSSPQVKKIMGVHKSEDGIWKTKCGVILEPTESGNSGALRTDKLYNSTLPEAKLIADIRGMTKARDVFLQKYILEGNINGYVHCNINQTRSEAGDAGTYTGRLSITDPALQQIHKRQKRMAQIVRSCFIPEDDHDWVCWDYSQIDFRCMAHYANDPPIIEAYQKDPTTDFHSIVAEVTGLPRNRNEKTGGANAKQINLGLSFNMGAGRLAREMGLPYTVDDKGYLHAGPEAMAIFEKYHTAIPGPGRLKDQVAAVAASRGHILTQLGRRLRFDRKVAYKASGILYQATAAEILKVKMVELHEALQPEVDARYLITVHDEHDLSLPKSRRPGLEDDITALLERFDGNITPLQYRIPMLTSKGVGPNWWEASK